MTSLPQRIRGLLLLGICLFGIVSILGFSPIDPPRSAAFPRSESIRNIAGLPGAWTAFVLLGGLGVAAVVPLLAVAVQGIAMLREKAFDQLALRTIGLLMVTTGLAALAAMTLPFGFGPVIGPGGYLGALSSFLLEQYVTMIGAVAFFGSLLLAGMILTCDATLLRACRFIAELLIGRSATAATDQVAAIPTPAPVNTAPQRFVPRFPSSPEMREEDDDEYEYDDEYDDYDEEEEEEYEDEDEDEEYEEEYDEEFEEEKDSFDEPITTPAVASAPQPAPRRSGGLLGWFLAPPKTETTVAQEMTSATATDATAAEEETQEYRLPPLDILTPAPPFDYDSYEATVKRQARQLEKAFADFGFNVKVVDIQTGPVIAQFEIQLEKGLRLNKILGLTDDLAIALKVPSVRIVAPLPGKNTVGIELPNIDRQMVRLRDVMEQSAEAAAKMAIPIYLGMDVTGGAMPIDLAKLPHLLIAGRTGTGKSVCLNSIIVSMLMTRRPDEVKMLMIDPKMVELSPYKTIPHLMHPVVTDMKKAEAILGWAVDKMEERYQLLACAGVRQLSEYNKLTEEQLYKRIKPQTTDQWDAVPKKMPYLVIVADEMADLMMTSGKEVETHIIRLAQKSRAVGIHLVLATQKPTVDIITGLIKSNLPARIAFEVASRSDSQVVLDRNGAEKLLGNGDMLFLRPGTSQVTRGQGTYVSDAEIESIIAVVSTGEQEFAEELVALDIEGDAASGTEGDESGGQTGGKEGRDDLYYKAVEHVIREGRGSVSLLQRKLGIGYGRASRMIDYMAEDGVVGEYNGSKSREVVMTLSQWKRRLTAGITDAPKQRLQPTISPSRSPSSEPPKRKPLRSKSANSSKKEDETTPSKRKRRVNEPISQVVVSELKRPIRRLRPKRQYAYEEASFLAAPVEEYAYDSEMEPYDHEEYDIEYYHEDEYEYEYADQ